MRIQNVTYCIMHHLRNQTDDDATVHDVFSRLKTL